MSITARWRRSGAALLAAFALPAGLHVLRAQDVGAPQSTFRAGVDLVQVDVSVLDKARRPVRGLTAADFTVLEDGKPRAVAAFVAVDLAEATPVSGRARWVRDVAPDVTTNAVRPEGRLVVVMLDWSIRFEDQELARRIAAAAIDQLGPDDLAAVVFSSAFGNNGTPQNFTADRSRLLASINRPFAMALHNPRVGPGHDPRNQNEVMIDDPEGYESGDCLCRVCVPETIRRVADAVRDVRGRRKIMLFIGTYFRSHEALQGPESRPRGGPPPAVSGIVRPSEFTMACSGPLRDAREKMVRATSQANLTIHTIDPVGLETALNSPMGGSPQGMRERQQDLGTLADLTGGRAIGNTEAPELRLPELFAESRSYYLLAFAPADPKADGKYHRIEVTVNRPDVSVRTRAGFVAAGGRETRAAAVGSPDAVEAIGGVLPRTDVPLAVTVSPFAAGDGSAVAVVLGVNQQAAQDGSSLSREVKVLVAAFDRNGREVRSQNQTVGVTLRPDASGRMPYEVLSRLALPPGRFEIRAAVDAGPNERASVFTFVDVPEFSRQPISLSGIVLGATPAGLSAPRDAFTGLLPIVPTGRRTFTRGNRVTAFARVYQSEKERVQPALVTTRITDVQDRVVLDESVSMAAERFANGHAADHQLELPLDQLKSGEYLLTIDAAQGDHAARRGMRFTVR